ncbi:four helix bundle protein [Subsaxibacter sp. CAU 1640]|uniref:four helix bundle protein n=1 Tax=Subsaxibacter sp. CAU 1640 TaxID=2933271 RepID=UPI002005D453|nr:four helix bundle protein [Subsaxibacter sp. CAU 1640]MCK7589618.1 four helix bundle protein [Subsaxibacter sp. CAU 1640]
METYKFKFEDLKVYNKALDFVDLTYRVCENFPNSERFTLASQFIRASISIALNIAEGSSDTDKQFNRFLQMALDSVNECVVCSTISLRQNYITADKNIEIRQKLVELSKMITSLQKHLKQKSSNL